jgi:hypothetical protein
MVSKRTIKNFEQWHKSQPGLLIFGLAELLAAFLVGTRALDTGSWWEYGFTFLLFVGGAQNMVRLVKVVAHGKRP